MTKYIDLLREHENKKSGKKKNTKKKQKKGDALSNPYRENNQETDHELLEAIDELIEEEESELVAEDDMLNESMPQHDIVLDEQDSAATQHAAEPSGTEPVEESTSFESEHAETTHPTSAWLVKSIDLVSSVFTHIQTDEASQTNDLRSHIESFVHDSLSSSEHIHALESEILGQTHWHSETEGDVSDLVQKSVYMMLYALKVGQHLQYEQTQLTSFTITSMLHHTGLALIPADTRLQHKAWRKHEYKQLDEAYNQALTYLQASGLSEEELQIIDESRERYDGSGPKELEGKEIILGARFIGLLTTFEAMTHTRPYRKTLLARTAIRELVKEHIKAFDSHIFKALIEAISLYPVGTIVQINTGEIGHVVRVHSQLPLRPRILINMDKQANPIDERDIDLANQSNLMIVESFFEDDLKDISAS